MTSSSGKGIDQVSERERRNLKLNLRLFCAHVPVLLVFYRLTLANYYIFLLPN
jgi:hypothetical protein